MTDETGQIGLPSRKVPCTKSLISSRASSKRSSSTMSILVKATIPCSIPMRLQISICSLVWGMTPSSAAITIATTSIPLEPATIFFTNFSWPGISTMPICCPLGRSSQANPSSMVIPLSFSSLSRSVSIPVNALTRLVFP